MVEPCPAHEQAGLGTACILAFVICASVICPTSLLPQPLQRLPGLARARPISEDRQVGFSTAVAPHPVPPLFSSAWASLKVAAASRGLNSSASRKRLMAALIVSFVVVEGADLNVFHGAQRVPFAHSACPEHCRCWDAPVRLPWAAKYRPASVHCCSAPVSVRGSRQARHWPPGVDRQIERRSSAAGVRPGDLGIAALGAGAVSGRPTPFRQLRCDSPGPGSALERRGSGSLDWAAGGWAAGDWAESCRRIAEPSGAARPEQARSRREQR